MGYYTSFTLTMPRNPIEKVLLAQFIKHDKIFSYVFDEDGSPGDSAKWYDYDKGMIELSSQYPNTIFRLHGEGEAAGDVWDSYYLKGKLVYHIKINPILPEPDYDVLLEANGVELE